MDYRWMIYGKRADFAQISEQFHIDQVIARVIRNRDVEGEEAIDAYLHSDISNLYSPWKLLNMDTAVDIMMDKILLSHKVRIIADYDVDGVMSNFILYQGLKRAGADVDYEIPDRVADGYGINEALIKRAYDAGVNTIITCDNGIAAESAIRYAKELEMTVIVTDHHEVPYVPNGEKKDYKIPPADAVIDPKLPLCTYPHKEICGAAVAYKFVEALYEKRGIDKAELEPYLAYVGFATVCDVVPLLDENRTFVKLGLDLINKTDNEGMKALILLNELQDKQITEYHLGFVLGPCINATGRLESAMLAMRLLLSETKLEAMELAGQLFNLNQERKAMTQEYEELAYKEIEESALEYDKVLVVYLEDCHESIAGIIAGRIRERYYRPAFVLCKTQDNLIKGSGRSIEEYNMYEALTAAQEYLLKFGGHPMAAGLTLELQNLEAFRTFLNENCPLERSQMFPTIRIDVPMPIDYVSFDLIEQLELLKPYGKGNEKPLFAQSNLRVTQARILGKTGNVLRLTLEDDNGATTDAIYFQVEEFLENIRSWYGVEECDQMLHGWLNHVMLDVAYYPEINEFNGQRSVQLKVKYYRKSE